MTSPAFPTVASVLMGAGASIHRPGVGFPRAWGGQRSLHLNGLFVEEQRSCFQACRNAQLIHFRVTRKPEPARLATMANLIASLRQPKNSQLEHQNSNGNLFSLFCMFLSLAALPLCPCTFIFFISSSDGIPWLPGRP